MEAFDKTIYGAITAGAEYGDAAGAGAMSELAWLDES